MGFLSSVRVGGVAADSDLLARARDGDRQAFAGLWQRHYAAGLRAARAMTRRDADDVVSESFARILRLVDRGKGPTGAFRPYLYATIRSLVASQGRSAREVTTDDLDRLLEPTDAADERAEVALDRSLTARAFRSLPDRWQTVLWYTEVEGLDPHEVAPLLGITPNAAAVLAFRAREGLRVAWLQAHVDDARTDGECRWAMQHVGRLERSGLTGRDAERLAFHLSHCAHCEIVSEEVHDVAVRLRAVLLPLVVGAGAAAHWTSQTVATATAATGAVSVGTVGVSTVAASTVVKAAAGLVIIMVGTIGTGDQAPPSLDAAPAIDAPSGDAADGVLELLGSDSVGPAPDDALSTVVSSGSAAGRSLTDGAPDAIGEVVGTLTGPLGEVLDSVLPPVRVEIDTSPLVGSGAVGDVGAGVTSGVDATVDALLGLPLELGVGGASLSIGIGGATSGD